MTFNDQTKYEPKQQANQWLALIKLISKFHNPNDDNRRQQQCLWICRVCDNDITAKSQHAIGM